MDDSAHNQKSDPFSLKSTDIPKSFYSFETGKPFHECLVCGMDLTLNKMPYFIEKAFRKYPGYSAFDITYEFAMCFQCAEDLRQDLSIESQNKMREYMEAHVDFNDRRQSMSLMDPSQNIEPWLDHCLVTGEPLEEQNEYVLYGYFQGNSMMVSDFPYAIGPKAMDELTDLLSNKTLGEMDDFMGRYFTGPPEVNELFKPRRPVLL